MWNNFLCCYKVTQKWNEQSINNPFIQWLKRIFLRRSELAYVMTYNGPTKNWSDTQFKTFRD